MLSKGFLKQRSNSKTSKAQITKGSNIILVLGIILAISSLIYMLLNLAISDQIITIWLPFMAASLFLIFISQLLKWIRFNPNKK